MIVALKAMYQTQAKTDRYEITMALWSCHMAEGGSVSGVVLPSVGVLVLSTTALFSDAGRRDSVTLDLR